MLLASQDHFQWGRTEKRGHSLPGLLVALETINSYLKTQKSPGQRRILPWTEMSARVLEKYILPLNPQICFCWPNGPFLERSPVGFSFYSQEQTECSLHTSAIAGNPGAGALHSSFSPSTKWGCHCLSSVVLCRPPHPPSSVNNEMQSLKFRDHSRGPNLSFGCLLSLVKSLL